ncbi:arylsulfatase A-like [Synchiropus splendidus]|uniref:arylsulfatase A-like n=1 Tax=Synchiropus splendidus TaxID=270530 RepID=UPI00237E5C1C|nr:arylsulfatase A-like [Synchiropus splendidus]
MMKVLLISVAGILSLFVCEASPPNFIIIFADDLGFGDLGCYGHPSSLTPNLDRLAMNGLRFTDFYSASPLCSPSRASLLTGRYPVRSGVYPKVFDAGSIGGLPLNETTIAEVLKPRGYATALVGKWHLGVGANGKFLPTNQGFDQFLGIPYAHNMGPCHNLTCFPPDVKCSGFCEVGTVLVPLMRNDTVIQQPVDFLTLEQKYSDVATTFIATAAEKQQPFFLFHSSQHTHGPPYAGVKAAGRSLRGPFGDALLEFDQTVGDILATLERTGVINNTLVFFTSDNGPSLVSYGGNSGLLKCGKGTTYDGGMRMPAIAFWPGVIKPGVTHELASTLDLLPTITTLAGAKLPQVQLDGVDMANILFNHTRSERETMMFYPTTPPQQYGLFAVRWGKYKAHYYTSGSEFSDMSPNPDCPPSAKVKSHDPPLVFDLEADPSENFPLTLDDTPDLLALVEKIKRVKEEFEATMEFGESQILKGTDVELEPCCNPRCTPKPTCCHC